MRIVGRLAISLLLATALPVCALADGTALPPRRDDAPSGSAFAATLTDLSLVERERAILHEAARGNVPEFWRKFVEVRTADTIDGAEANVTYRVSPDYFAIGSDADYFLTPLTPRSAQVLADMLDCVLPTRKMADAIYRAAALKLEAIKLPPSPAMTTVPVFLDHNRQVAEQRRARSQEFPLGTLVAGHKKDVVITPRLRAAPGKVAIYGWHQGPEGKPIQPLYLGHTETWVDYSHGIRLVAREVAVNGTPSTVDAVLADPKLNVLLSDEGPLDAPRVVKETWEEVSETVALGDGIECVISKPADFDAAKATRLIIYALPNGNTIEQTIGKRLQPGDDWHFDIQHIGAQIRWLRAQSSEENVAIAYLVCAERSWPTWRKKNGDARIPEIIEKLRGQFPAEKTRVVLTGHSGGGSLTFGYLNAIESIADWIDRIAFLDSNYAYDSTLGHDRKLADWLGSSEDHRLCVLAYDDASALLNGKPFVSAKGGSWGRSHAMVEDLGKRFAMQEEVCGELRCHTALGGRVQFLLKENPGRKILHTRLVELNGFIHAMVAGTRSENYGYLYLGPRVYNAWIEAR